MENNRCYGCMKEKQNHPICEHCGFDERKQNDIHQLPMGAILRGQYLIGRVLGQGGFGITYLGWDMYLDMPVAIKEFYPGSIVTRDVSVSMSVTSHTAGAQTYETNKERFMREAKTLAKFENLSSIVKIYSFFPENNTVYLVMEYAKGHTLLDQLKKTGTMPLAQIVDLLRPVMEDLQQVHEAGIIHRDISPDNIMLLEDGGAKLLDFGAVRLVENADQEAQLSKSTEAILKQGFAPAEQYNARGSLGPWTDVYALCATICYCLNGKLPHTAPDRAIDEDPEHFIDILPITREQKQVLRRGMALRPKDRTASVAELLEQLGEALAGKSVAGEKKKNPPLPSSDAPVPDSEKRKESEKPASGPASEKSDPASRTSKAHKTKKKSGKRLPAILCAAAVAVILIFAVSNIGGYAFAKAGNYQMAGRFLFAPGLTGMLNPELGQYGSASRMMLREDYAGAADAYAGLSGFLNSRQLALEASYQYGLQCMEKEDFREAVEVFRKLKTAGYEDSFLRLADARYGLGMQLMDQHENMQAYRILEQVSGWKDMRSTLSYLAEQIYQEGVELYRQDDFYGADDRFKCIGNYKEAISYRKLIDLNMTGVNEYNVEDMIDSYLRIIDCEDASGRLLSGDLALHFLRGNWQTQGVWKYFRINENDYVSLNLPLVYEGNWSYWIEDGLFTITPENDPDRQYDCLKMTVISEDCMDVYCYADHQTYRFYRQ